MKANEQRKKGKRVCRQTERAKGKWKRLLCSLSDTSRADKKEGDDDRCFFGPHVPTRRLPTPPVVDYSPDPSSITDLTRRRFPTGPVLDYRPRPSSITHPTRPRLPTRPVLDHPFDPSSITEPTGRRFTDPTRNFTLPEFLLLFSSTKQTRQFPAHNVLSKSKPALAGYVGPVRVSTRASTRVSYALTDGQWFKKIKIKNHHTLLGRALPLLNTCNALT
jgi:hypothetical protein